MKNVRIGAVAAAVFAIVAATCVVVMGLVAVERRHSTKLADFGGVEGAGRGGYECQTPKPISAAAAWPVPADADRTGTDIYTKVVRRGTGTRKPELDSRHVVVLCVTYYNRDGSVREHDPSAIIELDPGPSRWCDVAALMTEGEIRRVWMPDKESPGGTMIADFEMQPWPDEVKARLARWRSVECDPGDSHVGRPIGWR